MAANIFNLVGSNFVNRRIKVITPFKEFEGVLVRVDDDGNLTLKLDTGLALIQRKFVSSIEISDQKRL